MTKQVFYFLKRDSPHPCTVLRGTTKLWFNNVLFHITSTRHLQTDDLTGGKDTSLLYPFR